LLRWVRCAPTAWSTVAAPYAIAAANAPANPHVTKPTVNGLQMSRDGLVRGIRRFASVLAIGAAVAVTPLTAAADGTTIAGVTLATDKTSVSGTDVATLTVTLHLVDPNGVAPQAGDVESGPTAAPTCW
jgi:hypothetical protein